MRKAATVSTPKMEITESGGKWKMVALLVTSEFEMLAALDHQQLLLLRLGAFETKNDLLGGLGLFVEDGFCLSSVSGLFSVVTTFSLCVEGGLSGLVLGDLEGGVFVHLRRKGLSRLRDVDHRADSKSVRQSKSDSKM